MTARPLRAAVIGAGQIGRHHARIYRGLEDVELIAVADLDPAILRKVISGSAAVAYTDFRTLLAESRPDVISVAVPTPDHFLVASEVIRRGIPVLVEKPLALTVEQGEALVDLAERTGVSLMVGQIERFNPAISEVRRRLADQELGRLLQIRALRVGPFPDRVKEVGVVLDLATHDIDMMRYLVGSEVVRIFAETQGRSPYHEDLLSGSLRFANGVIGVLDVNWVTPTKIRQLSILGQRGLYHIDYITQDLYWYKNAHADGEWDAWSGFPNVWEGDMIKVHVPKAEPLEREILAFVTAIAENREPPVSGRDGLETLRLAQGLVASGAANRPLIGIDWR